MYKDTYNVTTFLLLVLFFLAPIFAFCGLSSAHAQTQPTPVPVPCAIEKLQLGTHVQVLLNVPDTVTIEEVSSHDFSQKFIPNPLPSINLGTTNSTNWFRFTLSFEDQKPPVCATWLLYLGKQLDNYDELKIFWRDKNKDNEMLVGKWHTKTFGLHHATLQNKRDPVYMKLPRPKAGTQEIEFYMRIKTETAFFIEPILFSLDGYLAFIGKLKIFYGLYYGLALSMIIYNLFHYFFLKDKIRLIFIMYAIAISAYFFLANELSSAIIPIAYLEATKKGAQFFILLTFGLCTYFAIEFLNAKKIMPFLYRLLQLAVWGSLAFILALSLFSYYLIGKVLLYYSVLTITLILIAGFIAWGRGYRPAKYFLLAWIFFLVGGLTYTLNFMGIFPYGFIGNNAAQAGSGIEMVLLSLAIADRVKFAFEGLTLTQKKREEQLKNLSHQLVQTEESERRRIAGRLHDSIGQALCASKLEIQQVLRNRDLTNDSKAISYLDYCIQETRSLTSELYPQVLYQFGLTAGLDSLVADYKDRHNLLIKTDWPTTTPNISEELQFLLYRAVAELMNNIIKHASADSAEIKLTQSDTQLKIMVIDDGIGYEYSSQKNSDKNCFGLFSIQERLNRIGGSLSIEPNPPGGTRITISTPHETSATPSNNKA